VDEGVHQMGRQLGTSNGLARRHGGQDRQCGRLSGMPVVGQDSVGTDRLAIGSIPGGPPGGRNDTPASSSAVPDLVV